MSNNLEKIVAYQITNSEVFFLWFQTFIAMRNKNFTYWISCFLTSSLIWSWWASWTVRSSTFSWVFSSRSSFSWPASSSAFFFRAKLPDFYNYWWKLKRQIINTLFWILSKCCTLGNLIDFDEKFPFLTFL